MTNDVIQVQYWGPGSEWFWAFLQFVVVAITLWYIAKQLRIQTASHIVQTVCALQERWNSDFMLNVRLAVCTHWKSHPEDFDGACEQIAEFMEELGMFAKTGAIPNDLMWDFQSWNIECYWAMFKDGITKLRERAKDETLYEDFESMLKKMNEINNSRRVSPKNCDDVSDFVEREIRSTQACLNVRKKRSDK